MEVKLNRYRRYTIIDKSEDDVLLEMEDFRDMKSIKSFTGETKQEFVEYITELVNDYDYSYDNEENLSDEIKSNIYKLTSEYGMWIENWCSMDDGSDKWLE